MILTASDIKQLDPAYRINLVNALPGVRPVNLIGTASARGLTNLAVFSSVVHLGSSPALLGFVVRPHRDVPRHTYENIRATGCFTINQVSCSYTEQAHHTSEKFPADVSEFAACGFSEQWIPGFAAPFVAESLVRIGLVYRLELPVPLNGTTLVIGEVQHIEVDDRLVDAEGRIDLALAGAAGVAGVAGYYSVQQPGH